MQGREGRKLTTPVIADGAGARHELLVSIRKDWEGTLEQP